MNSNIGKVLASGLGALIVAGALASTPALARGGGHGGGFFDLSNFSDYSRVPAYDSTPAVATSRQCHKETRKLYDDNDNVVAHQTVMVCPSK